MSGPPAHPSEGQRWGRYRWQPGSGWVDAAAYQPPVAIADCTDDDQLGPPKAKAAPVKRAVHSAPRVRPLASPRLFTLLAGLRNHVAAANHAALRAPDRTLRWRVNATILAMWLFETRLRFDDEGRLRDPAADLGAVPMKRPPTRPKSKPHSTDKRPCPKCQQPMGWFSKTCRECFLAQARAVVPKGPDPRCACGAPMSAGSKRCMACYRAGTLGGQINAPAPAAPDHSSAWADTAAKIDRARAATAPPPPTAPQPAAEPPPEAPIQHESVPPPPPAPAPSPPPASRRQADQAAAAAVRRAADRHAVAAAAREDARIAEERRTAEITTRQADRVVVKVPASVPRPEDPLAKRDRPKASRAEPSELIMSDAFKAQLARVAAGAGIHVERPMPKRDDVGGSSASGLVNF